MTWTRCECGCGWEGEDEVTQFLIEEAAWIALDVAEMNQRRESDSEEDAEATYQRLRAKAEAALQGR